MWVINRVAGLVLVVVEVAALTADSARAGSVP